MKRDTRRANQATWTSWRPAWLVAARGLAAVRLTRRADTRRGRRRTIQTQPRPSWTQLERKQRPPGPAAPAAHRRRRPPAQCRSGTAVRPEIRRDRRRDGDRSPPTLSDAYGPYIGLKLSQADLLALAAAVTERYRSAGYHLSRAIIPPQDLAGGRLRLQVVEGVDRGYRRHRRDVTPDFGLEALLAPIAAERPSRLSTLERQLLLANERPGLRITDTSLDEIGTATGRFRLTVTAQSWRVFSAAGVDNAGSEAVGSLAGLGQPGLQLDRRRRRQPRHRRFAWCRTPRRRCASAASPMTCRSASAAGASASRPRAAKSGPATRVGSSAPTLEGRDL